MSTSNLPDNVSAGDYDAPWNECDAAEGKTCGQCARCLPFGENARNELMQAVPSGWRDNLATLRAVDGIVRDCGWCDAFGVVTYREDAVDGCGCFEQGRG